MSLNLCKNITYGQQSGYQITADTINATELVQYSDEYMGICYPVGLENTTFFRIKVFSVNGSTDKASYVWQNDGMGNSWCLVTMVYPMVFDSYVVVVNGDSPAYCQPWGVVKLSSTEFKVSARFLTAINIAPCDMIIQVVGVLI